MWLACATQEEVAAEVGISRASVEAETGLLTQMENLPNLSKVPALFAEADFAPPLFNVWTSAKKTEAGCCTDAIHRSAGEIQVAGKK